MLVAFQMDAHAADDSGAVYPGAYWRPDVTHIDDAAGVLVITFRAYLSQDAAKVDGRKPIGNVALKSYRFDDGPYTALVNATPPPLKGLRALVRDAIYAAALATRDTLKAGYSSRFVPPVMDGDGAILTPGRDAYFDPQGVETPKADAFESFFAAASSV